MADQLPPSDPGSTASLDGAVQAGSISDLRELLAGGADPNMRNNWGITPLRIATWSNQHEKMRLLIAAGAAVDERDERGESLLALAASQFIAEAVHVLLAAGADPNDRQGDDPTILMRAIRASWASINPDGGLARRITIVRSLLVAGADVNAIGPRGETPLSATEGEDELVRLLLEAGAVANLPTPGQQPLLFRAMGWGRLRPSQEDGILRLIAAGADVNANSEHGMRALKRACALGSRRVVAALLEVGARRVGSTNRPGRQSSRLDNDSPELHLAAWGDNPSIVQMLLQDGAGIEETDYARRTPLYWAANYGRAEVIRVLLAAGADPNAGQEWGLSPLRVAAFDGHAGCAALLLAAGAEVDGETPGGVTALQLAALWQRTGVVSLLLLAGADPNRADTTGRTSLMAALQERPRSPKGRRRALAVVEHLLTAGADPHATDQRGETALFAAARTSQTAAVRLLLACGAAADLVSREGKRPLSVVDPWYDEFDGEETIAVLRAASRMAT